MSKLFGYLIIAPIILLFMSYTSIAQTEREISDFNNLDLKISTDKEDFVQLEPIPIKFVISNNTTNSILGHTSLDFRYPWIKLVIIYNDKSTIFSSNTLSSELVQVVVQPRIIIPGEKQEKTQVLRFCLNKLFSQPGTYQIHFVLQNSVNQEEILSNTLTINILYPSGQDLAAFEYISNHGDPDDYFGSPSVNVDTKLRNNVEQFVKYFGDTVYGSYASLFLGLNYISLAELSSNISEQKLMYKNAIKHLLIVMQKEKFALQEDALKQLIEVYGKSGDIDQVRLYFSKLTKKYPESEYVISPPYKYLINKPK